VIFRFGPLTSKWTITFNGGNIERVPEFEEAAALVYAHAHQDCFLYPPQSRDVVVDPKTGQTLQEIPKTQRPARLFHLPSSHSMDLPDIVTDEPHRESHAFILHLLGYLFGVRLQFGDWYFDDRIPVRLYSTHNIDVSHATCTDFLSHCYDIWRGLRAEDRKLLINILAMHCRAPSYLWDWEQFMMEYTVLDGCWNLATSQHGLPANTPHKERINTMCKRFGLRYQDDGRTHIDEIVRLRNDLFHEATWDSSQPGMAVGEGFIETHHLRRLNQRLFPALLGYDTGYIRTPWWIIDTLPFG